MMDYIFKQLENNYPQCLDVTKELEILQDAKKASFDKADSGISEMKGQLNIIQKLAEAIEPMDETDQINKLKIILAKNAQEFSETVMVWEDVQKEWASVASSYCKDATKLKPEAFFVQIQSFVQQFQDIKNEIEKKKLEEEKKAQKANKTAEDEAKRAVLAAKKAALQERKK